MVKHRIRGRKFGRKTKHRIALKRNLVAALIEHGRIVFQGPQEDARANAVYREIEEHGMLERIFVEDAV